MYAIVEFASEDCALRALQHSDPLMLHGKKLVVKPRELKPHPRTEKKGKGKGKSGSMDEEEEEVMDAEVSGELEVLGGVRLPEGTLERVGQAQTVRCHLIDL